MMWGVLAGHGNPNHGGSWIAALLGLVICQPWVGPMSTALHPRGDLSAWSLGLSAGLNLVLIGFGAFRRK